MAMQSAGKSAGMTRRQAFKTTGKALAGLGCIAAVPSLSGAADALDSQAVAASPRNVDSGPTEKLRIATCQFPVSANCRRECEVHSGLHAPGGCRGSTPAAYIGSQFVGICGVASFLHLRTMIGTRCARRPPICEAFARGSEDVAGARIIPFFGREHEAHQLHLSHRSPEGKIVDRYDKCFCTARRPEILLGRQPPGDARHSRSENRPGHLLRHLLAAALYRLPGEGRYGDGPFLV